MARRVPARAAILAFTEATRASMLASVARWDSTRAAIPPNTRSLADSSASSDASTCSYVSRCETSSQ